MYDPTAFTATADLSTLVPIVPMIEESAKSEKTPAPDTSAVAIVEVQHLYDSFMKASQRVTLAQIEAVVRLTRYDATAIAGLVFAYLGFNDFDNAVRVLLEIEESLLQQTMPLIAAVSEAVKSTVEGKPQTQEPSKLNAQLIAELGRYAMASDKTTGPKRERSAVEKRDFGYTIHCAIRDLLGYSDRSSPVPHPLVFAYAWHLLIAMTKEHNVIPLQSTFFILIDRVPTMEGFIDILRMLDEMNIFNPRLATTCGKTLHRLGMSDEAQWFVDMLSKLWPNQADMLPKARASRSAIAKVRHSTTTTTATSSSLLTSSMHRNTNTNKRHRF